LSEVGRAGARRRLGFSDDDVVLLVMGTVEPRKAQSVIVEAFSLVAAKHPDARLALVGDMKTDYSAAIRDFINVSGLANRARLIPVQREIEPWYAAADALICASDIESLPRSVLEAMAFGAPIIATNVFGLGELLVEGETGYLCEARSLSALVDCIEQFLEQSPDQRAAVGAAGRALVLDQRDSAQYAETIRDMLEALVSRR
jgi:glycosyltransferase involved in cell wall biosynthesis